MAPLALPVTVSYDDRTVTLSQSQLQHIKAASVELHDLANRRETIGNIDFSQDRAVQVFTSYQDKIRNIYAKMGDTAVKGKPLFDIDSPDPVQVESTLISTVGTRKLTTAALTRTCQLFEIQGLVQKDLDQAIFNQQAMEAAYKAACEALIVFGKTPTQMDQIVKTCKTDLLLMVASLISDQTAACSAQPGLLLQPGNGTAPFTAADVPTMWMQAFVPEAGAPLLHVGQPVKVHVMAFPDQTFNGKITTAGASVNANTHRILVRSEINDPKHGLRPGTLTSFDITTGASIQSPALAVGGVVRKDDGVMTTQVMTNRKCFMRRVIKLDLEQDGFVRVLEGLSMGELAANGGAPYLSAAAAGNFSGTD